MGHHWCQTWLNCKHLPHHCAMPFWKMTILSIDNQDQWLVTCTCIHYTYSTMKIVGSSTISQSDHHVAKTHELECTKVVVPQVVAWGVLQDYWYMCVHVLPRSECSGGCAWYAACCWTLCEAKPKAPQLLWHMAWYEIRYSVMFALVWLHCTGTKNVAKELAKITKGRVKDQEVNWFYWACR